MKTYTASPYIPTGFTWTECPRWHNGRLYFSDLHRARVVVVNEDGSHIAYADLSERAAQVGMDVVVVGTGFLPDGRLLINSMFEQLTLVWDGTEAKVYADLRGLASGPINDMVVDSEGRAYVSQLGYDPFFKGEPRREAPIMVIEPDGMVRVVEEAGLMSGPNGMAITDDGHTLIVSEMNARVLTAFDRGADGRLANRRVFASLDGRGDGICADVEGGVWASLPEEGGVIRVLDGGVVDSCVDVDVEAAGSSIACVLGGEDRKTLYICCGFEIRDFDKSRREAKGSIWCATVEVAAGRSLP